MLTRLKGLPLALICLLYLLSCGTAGSEYGGSAGYDEDSYPDGTYCATVEYYYSNTGTNSEYTLKVDIEDGNLVKIYWPNGGWLDDSHFDPPDISGGTASFETDRGMEYTVTITGKEGDCSYDSDGYSEEDVLEAEERMEERREELRRQKEEAEETCPKCYGYKNSWDRICDNCQDEAKYTCRKCGTFEYGISGVCSECRESEEEQEDY